MRWCVYDPLLTEAQAFATHMSFGDNARLVPRLERADVILRSTAIFWIAGRRSDGSSRFSSRRRVSGPQDAMNRLYVVENRFTLTGAMADHRLRCAASQIPAFAFALAQKIAVATKDAGLAATIATLKAPDAGEKFDEQWLTEVSNELLAKPGASLVMAGSHQPVVVQFLAYAVNVALKNVGTTLIVREFARNPKTNSILQLASEISGAGSSSSSFLAATPFIMRREELRRIARQRAGRMG
jgi:molybdopterin-containing oxidoreductase family iron-sulfur binding subunit